MKKILGLDLGTSSIGWALVNESEKENEKSSIVRLGVRVNPLTIDEQKNFEEGKSITTNAERTLKRSARRNLQRYKLRRESLIDILKENGFINNNALLSESGNRTTFQTLRLRAKAATEEISLCEFARVLLLINRKRGYKSSRKAKSNEDGQLIDGMEIAQVLYEQDLTPGEYSLQLIEKGVKRLPDFYRSDLKNEFEKVWNTQKSFYPSILTDDLKKELEGKSRKQIWAILKTPFNIVGKKREGKVADQKRENFQWRVQALKSKMDLESLAIVLQEVCGQIDGSSNYLGDISDRSKKLFFNHQTVGQYQMAELDANPNYSLKNEVFYRQDYLDEFEVIWERQATFHKELTAELKKLIRDVVIFYQRPLKSQKGLVSVCEFEQRKVEVEIGGKKKLKLIGPKVCPKSSPLFQDFKIWQILNNIEITNVSTNERFALSQDDKQILFEELCLKDKISKSDAIKLLFDNYRDFDLNYKEIEGNKTFSSIYKACQTIIEQSGHREYDFSKMKSVEVRNIVADIFKGLGYNTSFLNFDSSLEGKALEGQDAYQLWHLLYSFEGDNSKSGNEKLVSKISEITGMEKEYASIIAKIMFPSDYGSLSAKAIRKILPHLKDGLQFSTACEYAGYRHSRNSLTKEELERKELKDQLELLPRNSLRNPVVEKILNQMINVVNAVSQTYGRPDEIRIELARELKKSAQEREEMTKQINETTRKHEEYKIRLQKEFGLVNVSRNDIIRFKLYEELAANDYKTLYSNQFISPDKLFSKDIDIEHIIPQAKLFDDSFSNKTLEFRSVNLEKSNTTAMEYVKTKGDKAVDEYKLRIESLFKKGAISKTKRDKLLMLDNEIPSGFINRDLRDSQYIAKKAKEILEQMVKFVVTTTGSITDRLREDWQLVNVMQELNWEKYNKLGMTEYYEDRDGRKIGRIKDWTKRNDHRHHAMDALTIAFTKRTFIQYLNNLNARVQKESDEYIDLDMVEVGDLPEAQRTGVVYAIEKKYMHRDEHKKLRFNPPMELAVFRQQAKQHLESILVSIKAKNKVTTPNINSTKTSKGKNTKIQFTPRGQLHKETIYGSHKKYVTKEEKVGAAFDEAKIQTVAKKIYRELLLKRLIDNKGDAKKAFTGKNALSKNPIYLDAEQTIALPEKVKTVSLEDVYTIRKAISPDLKIDKVIDPKIREILFNRLKEYGGDAKKAFSDLENNPIYLNKEKNITIKRVCITGINNAVALHDKRDKDGNFILDENGMTQPVDFVSTGNNHHVAIYRDKNGNLQEHVVSLYEAVTRSIQGLPIIDKQYREEDGWVFQFTMKQNEYFVFPNKEEGFDPQLIDFFNLDNYSMISRYLYRVQKLTNGDYFFRHHLETMVKDEKDLKDTTWKRLGLSGIEGIVKVRVNHIGKIVKVGEY